jgi:hypothetical protein
LLVPLHRERRVDDVHLGECPRQLSDRAEWEREREREKERESQ